MFSDSVTSKLSDKTQEPKVLPVIDLTVCDPLSISIIRKEIHCKLTAGIRQGSNPQPPSPKANHLAQSHQGWYTWYSSYLVIYSKHRQQLKNLSDLKIFKITLKMLKDGLKLLSAAYLYLTLTNSCAHKHLRVEQ